MTFSAEGHGGRAHWLGCLAVLIVSGLSECVAGNNRPDGEGSEFQTTILPLLKTHCFDCHGNGASEGSLALDLFTSDADAAAKPEVWWNVLKNVRAGVMPPADHPRLTRKDMDQLADWIKFRAIGIDPENPDPGPLTVRRLNRTEYGNTVSDLMGIRFDAAILFPPDDSGFGFDNVGDALSMSPILMEKYLRAAQQIVDRAVPTVTWELPSQQFSGRDFRDETTGDDGDGMSSTKPALVKRKVQLEHAGRYKLEVAVRQHGSFDFDPSRYVIVFRIDGEERTRNEYGWDENKLQRTESIEEWPAGEHELSFELIPVPRDDSEDDAGSDESTYARFEVNTIRIEGPLDTTTLVHPHNYTRFFPRDEPPTDPHARREYAAVILQRFATRAFRGAVPSSTVDRLVDIAAQGWQQPERSFEWGVAQAMVGVLASPRFLFRLEATSPTDPAGDSATTTVVSVSEHALASRLSYFLWSTMPDDELFALAEQGQLRNQLSAQVARMMRDDRASDFVRNFVGQWLRTRDVTQVSVDPIAVFGLQKEYEALQAQFRNRRGRPFNREPTPEEQQIRNRFRELRAISDVYDDELKRAMQRETELCVEHIVREDLSLLDLLDCDYTFVNEDLAKHYGIPDVDGDHMRRVELPPDSPRGGVLGHASMLLVTSNPTRTSPVKRGLFILDNILGTPAPPAPPNVPELEAAASKFGDRDPTQRELLAAHRDSALCASCHARMDPLGFALENFNALGGWREQDKEQPIDASGTLITGESFTDVRELKRILRERHAADFYRCVTQKMLTFAIGRGLSAADQQTVDVIVERLEQSNGRFSDLIDGVVNSAPFQKQRAHVVAE